MKHGSHADVYIVFVMNIYFFISFQMNEIQLLVYSIQRVIVLGAREELEQRNQPQKRNLYLLIRQKIKGLYSISSSF